jgi:glycerol kinase
VNRTLADTVVADQFPALVAELAETDDQVKITHGGVFAAMLVSPQKWRSNGSGPRSSPPRPG